MAQGTVTARKASASTCVNVGIEAMVSPNGVTDMNGALLSGVRLALLVGLVFDLTACGRGQTSVPADAQHVHVSVAGSEVRLDPGTATAGDVYVVLDTPGSSVSFAQRKRTAVEIPRSLDQRGSGPARAWRNRGNGYRGVR